jgi:cytochrome c oxidase subunit 3
LSDPASLLVREQFATSEQQRETSSIGMWVFLASEVMMFGGLFMAYTVYRVIHPHGFHAGSEEMDIWLGSINTAVLLTSSVLLALAEHSIQNGRQRALCLLLIATMIVGFLFLGIKFTEYVEHYHEHKAPGVWFEYGGHHEPGYQMFFVFYFIMTGLHAAHMLVGICILGGLLFRAWLGRFTAQYHNPIMMGGIYWNFVDIIWIFLYAIFYLPGLHP